MVGHDDGAPDGPDIICDVHGQSTGEPVENPEKQPVKERIDLLKRCLAMGGKEEGIDVDRAEEDDVPDREIGPYGQGNEKIDEAV